MASQTYDFALAASVGASRNIQATGTRAKLMDCTGTGVTVRTDRGKLFRLKPGQGFKAEPGQAFRGLFVINPDAAAQTGSLFVGDEDFIDDRITGDVTVIDNGTNKTAQNGQFLGAVANTGSAVGYSLAGLRANVVTLAVKRLQVVSPVAGVVSLYQCNGEPTLSPANYANALRNKNIGQSASQARGLYGFTAAAAPTVGELPGVFYIASMQVAANVPVELPLTTPLRMAAGMGIVAQGVGVNVAVTLTADAEEVT